MLAHGVESDTPVVGAHAAGAGADAAEAQVVDAEMQPIGRTQARRMQAGDILATHAVGQSHPCFFDQKPFGTLAKFRSDRVSICRFGLGSTGGLGPILERAPSS